MNRIQTGNELVAGNLVTNGNSTVTDGAAAGAQIVAPTNGNGAAVAEESVASKVITAVSRIEVSEYRRKRYVLDTNVLIHDPGALGSFEENDLDVPMVVIEELDNLKRSSDREVAYQAREAIRRIEALREGGDLVKGVRNAGGGLIRVDPNHVNYEHLPSGFERKPDNIILLVAKRLADDAAANGGKMVTILVTKDTALRIKAQVMGIPAEDYMSDQTSGPDTLYQKMSCVHLPVAETVFREFGSKGFILTEEPGIVSDAVRTLAPNKCCVLSVIDNKERYVLALNRPFEKRLVLVPKPAKRKPLSKQGIIPRNDEQCFSYDVATGEGVPLIVIAGKAGTGKSLMALLAGCYEVFVQKRYSSLMIFRPTIEIGEPIGFLPGSLDEKFAPWARPAVKCLEKILDGTGFKKSSGAGPKKSTVEDYIRSGQIVFRPVNHIRGETFDNAFVIIDEVQNLTASVIKTAVTRAGDTTRIVLTGDLGQVDAPYLDARSNGLAHVIEKFDGQRRFGGVHLITGERSELAELAAQLL